MQAFIYYPKHSTRSTCWDFKQCHLQSECYLCWSRASIKLITVSQGHHLVVSLCLVNWKIKIKEIVTSFEAKTVIKATATHWQQPILPENVSYVLAIWSLEAEMRIHSLRVEK